MKEEIKAFLRNVQTIYLVDVMDAVDELCKERGENSIINAVVAQKIEDDNKSTDALSIREAKRSIKSAISDLEDALSELE